MSIKIRVTVFLERRNKTGRNPSGAAALVSYLVLTPTVPGAVGHRWVLNECVTLFLTPTVCFTVLLLSNDKHTRFFDVKARNQDLIFILFIHLFFLFLDLRQDL